MITKNNAIRMIENFNYLIGEDYHEMIIDILLVTPRNDPEFSKAKEQYLTTMDSSLIFPASEENGYTVTAFMVRKGLLVNDDLFKILMHKGIEIDFAEYGIEI